MKVTILGTGAFGLALGNLWHQHSNQEIILWTPFEEECKKIMTQKKCDGLENISLDQSLLVTANLEQALSASDLLIVAIPVVFISQVLKQVKKIDNRIATVIVSKGIEKESLSCPNEIFQNCELIGDYGYLGGPTFAIDVIKNEKTALSLATKSEDIKNKINKLFENTNIKIEQTKDIKGVEYCSSLKNVFAILMGALTQKSTSKSTKAYFLTLLYQEFRNIILALGAEEKTLQTFAGLGDFLLTCDSCSSRNYYYGSLLVKDFNEAKMYSENKTVEGKNTLDSLLLLLQTNKSNSRLLLLLKQLIDGTVNIEELFKIV